MVAETYSNKEVAVGICEMAREIFQKANKITKEANVLPTNADAAKNIKSSFDDKYWNDSMAIFGEGYGLFQRTQGIRLCTRTQKKFHISYEKSS